MHLLFIAGLLLSDPPREEQYEQLATTTFLPKETLSQSLYAMSESVGIFCFYIELYSPYTFL